MDFHPSLCCVHTHTYTPRVRLLGSTIWLKHLSPSLMHKKHQFIFSLTLWKKQAIAQPFQQITFHYVCALWQSSVLNRQKKGITSWKSIKFSDYKMVLHNVHSFSLNVSHSIFQSFWSVCLFVFAFTGCFSL